MAVPWRPLCNNRPACWLFVARGLARAAGVRSLACGSLCPSLMPRWLGTFSSATGTPAVWDLLPTSSPTVLCLYFSRAAGEDVREHPACISAAAGTPSQGYYRRRSVSEKSGCARDAPPKGGARLVYYSGVPRLVPGCSSAVSFQQTPRTSLVLVFRPARTGWHRA